MNRLARSVILLGLALRLQAQALPEPLEAGRPIDREVRKGAVHAYELQAGAGQYLHVIVTPRQADLKVTLTAPDGKPMAVVDVVWRDGPEEIAWILPVAGSYRISVLTTDADPRGAYELALEHLREPTAEDRPRAAAFEAFTAGEDLAAKANAESRHRATGQYEESLAIWRTIGDRFWEGRVLHMIAFNWEALGELIKARDALLAALPLRRAIGNRSREASTLNNLGIVYNGLGEPAKALEYFSPALEIRQSLKYRRGEAATLNNMANAHGNMGDAARAVEVLLQSLEIRREIGDRLGEAITLNNLASHYKDLGDLQKALFQFNRLILDRQPPTD